MLKKKEEMLDPEENAQKSIKGTRESQYLDLLGVFSLGDADHPQELVDVIATIANHSAKDDKNVIDVQLAHDLVRFCFIAGHGFADLEERERGEGVKHYSLQKKKKKKKKDKNGNCIEHLSWFSEAKHELYVKAD